MIKTCLDKILSKFLYKLRKEDKNIKVYINYSLKITISKWVTVEEEQWDEKSGKNKNFKKVFSIKKLLILSLSTVGIILNVIMSFILLKQAAGLMV